MKIPRTEFCRCNDSVCLNKWNLNNQESDDEEWNEEENDLDD